MAQPAAVPVPRIRTFEEFFPFYLGEHSNRTNRRLHFIGTTLFLLMVAAFLATGNLVFVPLMPLMGYGFAWIGHFFVEKNKPASFKYPLWSFRGDMKMYLMMWTGKL